MSTRRHNNPGSARHRRGAVFRASVVVAAVLLGFYHQLETSDISCAPITGVLRSTAGQKIKQNGGIAEYELSTPDAHQAVDQVAEGAVLSRTR
ncbi:hypothetical protein PLICRDRAFT_91546, partial [Plicaturopsis crispa FD-325 SS-3]